MLQRPLAAAGNNSSNNHALLGAQQQQAGRSSVSRPGRRCGTFEIAFFLVVISLGFSLIALQRLVSERDEWKERLVVTLRSTAEFARASESRLVKTLDFIGQKTTSEDLKQDSALGVDGGLKRGLTVDKSYSPLMDFEGSTTVILFCYARAHYLQRTLDSLKARLPSATRFRSKGLKVIISQDGYDGEVARISKQFVEQVGEMGVKAEHVQHERFDASRHGHLAAYYSLSMHYLKGLIMAFSNGASRVVILEDDLELAVDFFPFFEAFAGTLDRDASLLAVSAWNDHGQADFVVDPERFYRSDFFPGLGWMLPRRIWEELKPKWPEAYWDDWLRAGPQRKNRHTIHPEVSRTITFGESGGASQGLFFKQYLSSMKLNDVMVAYTGEHVKAMEKTVFDDWMMSRVRKAQLLASPPSGRQELDQSKDYYIEYSGLSQYEQVAKSLGIMTDIKDGIPRGAYRGIVPIRFRGAQVYIVPKSIPPLST